MTPALSASDRTLAAIGLTLVYATIIGFTDNWVRVIAAEAGLAQFHATRSAMAAVLLGLYAWAFGRRLAPRRWGPVLLRSVVHAGAMMVYFGALAFLPVALVAAGLFTAPIFVLLLSRFAFGHPLGPVHVLAVATGFLGVLFVLGPEALRGATLAALLPVLAGALYGLGNVVTREHCRDETPETLLAGFFGMIGVFGAVGLLALTLWPLAAAPGVEGFPFRGPVWPSGTFLFWTFVQAAGSLLGVGLIIRAYQIADASRVSVLEYVILPASAAWGWLLWGERLGVTAWAGMALIAAAGLMIALRARAQAAA